MLGLVTAIAILFIVVIALAGLGNVVVSALAESAWGVFTVGASIPIALGMGLYIHNVRGGSIRGIREATIAGVVLLFVALIAGKHIGDSSFATHLKLSKTTLTLAMAAYGFVASVLPVWMLLCPRDYLSSYLKIGTIALLVVGVIVVNPRIQMPGVTAVHPRRRAHREGAALPVRVHHHRVRRDQRLSRARRERHHAEDDRQGERLPRRSATARC